MLVYSLLSLTADNAQLAEELFVITREKHALQESLDIAAQQVQFEVVTTLKYEHYMIQQNVTVNMLPVVWRSMHP